MWKSIFGTVLLITLVHQIFFVGQATAQNSSSNYTVCTEASKTCCATPLNSTESYCMLFCMEDDRTCCNCNLLSNGKYKCFGCPKGSSCKMDEENYAKGGLLYYCASGSNLIASFSFTIFMALLACKFTL
mmetsp:Transcript_7598/g.10481  ORF Transcript_7598/g.10481 Transcript_7598/m.10481 type:complete len:130 (-) Transcript_7598:109-498(-)